jgi:hypothetical protein
MNSAPDTFCAPFPPVTPKTGHFDPLLGFLGLISPMITKTFWYKDQNISLKNQNVSLKNQNVSLKNQNVSLKNQNVLLKDRNILVKNQNVLLKDQNFLVKDQNVLLKDQNVLLKNQNVLLKNQNILVKDQNVSLKNQNVLLKNLEKIRRLTTGFYEALQVVRRKKISRSARNRNFRNHQKKPLHAHASAPLQVATAWSCRNPQNSGTHKPEAEDAVPDRRIDVVP